MCGMCGVCGVCVWGVGDEWHLWGWGVCGGVVVCVLGGVLGD